MDLKVLSPFLWNNVYHVGVVVNDIESSIREVGDQLGVTFDAPQLLTVTSGGPGGGGRPASVRLAYSHGEPPFLELLEASEDGVWTQAGGQRLHHVGVWTPDIKKEVGRLELLGFSTEMVGIAADERDLFAYLINAQGIRVELVAERIRAGLEGRLRG
jgi:hypothetical protein